MSTPADHEKSLGTVSSAGVHSLRDVAQQALVALEHGGPAHRLLAIHALRAALAEPEQEPVQEQAAPELVECRVMVCGVDCYPGDKHCNGYCTGKTDDPPKATAEQAAVFAADQRCERPSCDECGKRKADGWALYCVECSERAFAAALYTAPLQRKPLNEED